MLLQAEQQLRRDLSSMQAQLAQVEGQAARLQAYRAQLEIQMQQLQARSAPCITMQGTSGLAEWTYRLWRLYLLLNRHSPFDAILLCHAMQLCCLAGRLRAGSSPRTCQALAHVHGVSQGLPALCVQPVQ